MRGIKEINSQIVISCWATKGFFPHSGQNVSVKGHYLSMWNKGKGWANDEWASYLFCEGLSWSSLDL